MATDNQIPLPHVENPATYPHVERSGRPEAVLNVGLGDAWVHRSEGMRCRTCIWYVEKATALRPTAPREKVGRCRRHAPTMGGYPVVFISDWCGDHRLDENKA